MDFLKNGPEEKKENKIGLYSTLIFHLVLLIIMLCTGINTVVKSETSFVLDFSGLEEEEKILREEKIKEDVSKEIDEILSGKRPSVRNVAVDRSARAGERLKDDRGANDVYDEARKLQQKLDANRKALKDAGENEGDIAINKKSGKENNSNESYKGPSVISYRLDGRKAISLPIPAYKCYGGGDVTVAITVNPSGRVIKAEVVESLSSKDQCLMDYAVKAAKLSRFTASGTAPSRQIGEIVYRFVAQ